LRRAAGIGASHSSQCLRLGLVQAAARALHRVRDGRVDLILHGAIACPTGCHGILHLKSKFDRKARPPAFSRPTMPC
jgi:hypothetical protein